MARSATEVSKSDAVRNYLAMRPNAMGREVTAALKREGIIISESLVAKVKQRSAKPGRSKRPSSRISSNGSATGTSKADLIRQIAETMPKPVRPRDVVAALNEQGIGVSSAQVSQVLKAMGLKRRRRRGRKATPRTSGRTNTSMSETLSLANLLAAKKLVDLLGSVEAAKQAVDALAKLS